MSIIVKKLLYAVALTLTVSPATADYSLPAMPKKFQGTWTEAQDTTCPLFINANTVSHCSPNGKLKLVSIQPGDEELNTVTVTWLAPFPIKVIYRLIKSGGRPALVSVNAESPTSIQLFWKK
jgi:hypothetical protein